MTDSALPANLNFRCSRCGTQAPRIDDPGPIWDKDAFRITVVSELQGTEASAVRILCCPCINAFNDWMKKP